MNVHFALLFAAHSLPSFISPTFCCPAPSCVCVARAAGELCRQHTHVDKHKEKPEERERERERESGQGTEPKAGKRSEWEFLHVANVCSMIRVSCAKKRFRQREREKSADRMPPASGQERTSGREHIQEMTDSRSGTVDSERRAD